MSNDELLTDLTDAMIYAAMAECGIEDLTEAEVKDLREEVEAQSGGDWLPRSWWVKETPAQIRRIVKNRSTSATATPPVAKLHLEPEWKRRIAPPAWAFALMVAWQAALTAGLVWVLVR